MGLWVGTYAEKGGAGLHPIYLTRGAIAVGEPEPQIMNASYGVWCEHTRTAYFVDEQEAGQVSAWGLEEGRWIKRGACNSGGSLPCYLSLSPDRRKLAVANYGDGAVALIHIDPGKAGVLTLGDVAHRSGHGPDGERQKGPHAHCALFAEDGRTLYVVDLGLDRVFAYSVDGESLGPSVVAFTVPPGSGPRHLLLLPGTLRMLLLCELSAELFLLERTGAGFNCLDKVPTSPSPQASDNLGGHVGLAADGSILVTNRGHDSLVSFAVRGDRLVRGDWVHTGGASPRHVHARAGALLVAHEESGSVALLPPRIGADPQAVIAAVPGAAFIIEVPA